MRITSFSVWISAVKTGSPVAASSIVIKSGKVARRLPACSNVINSLKKDRKYSPVLAETVQYPWSKPIAEASSYLVMIPAQTTLPLRYCAAAAAFPEGGARQRGLCGPIL